MKQTINRRTMLGLLGTAAVVGTVGQATPAAAEPDAAATLNASAMTGYWAAVARDENGQGSAPERR